jgi:hypothetical protein
MKKIFNVSTYCAYIYRRSSVPLYGMYIIRYSIGHAGGQWRDKKEDRKGEGESGKNTKIGQKGDQG